MPVVWNFRKWLAVNKDIYRPSQLQQLIAQKEGVYISIQTLSGLLNNPPDSVRIKTMQVICDALECDFSEFFDIQHTPAKDKQARRKAVGEELPSLYGKRASNQSKAAKSDDDDDIYPRFRRNNDADETMKKPGKSQ